MIKKINVSLGLIYTITLSCLFLVWILIEKWFPLLAHSTIYFCRDIIGLVTPYRLPNNINMIPLAVIAVIVGSAAVKILQAVIQFFLLRQIVKRVANINKHPKVKKLLSDLNLASSVILIRDKRPLAFCFGFINPKIFITTKMISISSCKELQAILEHEKYHVKSKDNLVMFAIQVSKNLFPFIPLFGEFIQNYRVEREIAADRAAIESVGKRHLISSLRKLLLISENKYNLVPSFADDNTMEIRANSLLDSPYKQKYSRKSVLISLLSLGFLAFSAIMPVHAVEYEDKDGVKSIMACVHSQKCSMTCEEDRVTQNKSSFSGFSTPLSQSCK